MKTIANAENWQWYKSRFSLIVEQLVAFVPSTSLVREVKNLSLNFKLIA